MTHQDLCRLAVKWLKNKGKCHVAVSEISTGVEIPDAIGYTKNKLKTSRSLSMSDTMHICTMVEAKISRSDYLQDAKKPYRVKPETGVGTLRYYICPQGLILPEEIPECWGLLWVNARGHVRLKKEATPQVSNRITEVFVLMKLAEIANDPDWVRENLKLYREMTNNAKKRLKSSGKIVSDQTKRIKFLSAELQTSVIENKCKNLEIRGLKAEIKRLKGEV